MNYALVTGGSRGIGRAVCVKLAEMGYPVIVNYSSNKAAAEETKTLVEAQGVACELLPFNVSDAVAVDRAMDTWQESHPDDHISVLINNAGICKDSLMVFMSDEQWHSVIDTSLDGFFFVTRKLLKGMISKRKGRIVNIVSLSGLKGIAGQTNYSAAKAAVIGATKALAQEVAARKITVNAVAPGFITTDMTKDLDEEALKKTIPSGRFGLPDEVADLVAFLASEKAAYITGEVISINGGLYT
ncbi:3-oxoacyl-ACP reductase FabG [Bacteroidales bacterium OttesenSCG-928-B11]|nr:3-oxoacyl-ACP reductase FabG [Bacteroidales bacterium OttesenSCG-928-C03]MDL2311698.1 3-oxoacyl-ACP reductase FabG [Bacteroidales bacterium OttesenSCG-928-B11]MDL2325891.1 3-oxoacyl-ACP reductase FabG [Bacteroidales bacterium OttesenSCG-928-A14]